MPSCVDAYNAAWIVSACLKNASGSFSICHALPTQGIQLDTTGGRSPEYGPDGLIMMLTAIAVAVAAATGRAHSEGVFGHLSDSVILDIVAENDDISWRTAGEHW